MAKKRRQRRRGTPPTGLEAGRPAWSARWVSGQDFDVRAEVAYITGCAARGDGRVVTLGPLVFFSTAEGAAWMLDVEDSLACCLMREHARRESPVRPETAQALSIAWEGAFVIEGGVFLTQASDGRVTAWPGYPGDLIRQAVQRARNALP